MPTLHVRETDDGELEAVTFTASHGEPLVEVKPMRRSGLGWDISSVKTCARLALTDYEDSSFDTFRYNARRAHLVFLQPSDDSEARLRMAASGDPAPVVSDGVPDITPPKRSRIARAGRIVDGYDDSYLGRHYAFSEPLAVLSRVFIRDNTGAEADVHYIMSEGYVVGYRQRDLVAATLVPQLVAQVEDRAGNQLLFEEQHGGIAMLAISGDFESEIDFFMDERGAYSCDEAAAGTSTAAVIGPGFGNLTEVPALAGTRSFLIGNCPVYFRVTAGTETTLRFDARLLHHLLDDTASVEACFSSLAPGGEDICQTTHSNWSEDSGYAGGEQPVSTVQTLTFPLPAVGSDFMVALHSPGYLWLDNLRTE